jgi:hypothetical protein
MFQYDNVHYLITYDDTIQDTGDKLDPVGIDLFRKRLGEFLWICKIHPELSTALHKMASRVGRLTTKDPLMLDWMTGYLKKVQYNGLTFTPGVVVMLHLMYTKILNHIRDMQ